MTGVKDFLLLSDAVLAAVAGRCLYGFFWCDGLATLVAAQGNDFWILVV
jgi:hypothetical protein